MSLGASVSLRDYVIDPHNDAKEDKNHQQATSRELSPFNRIWSSGSWPDHEKVDDQLDHMVHGFRPVGSAA